MVALGRGGYDGCPQSDGQLQAHQADPAGPAVDEHRVACTNPCGVQRMDCGGAGQHERSRLGPPEACGLGEDRDGRGRDVVGVGAGDGVHDDLVTDLHVVHLRADLGNDACALQTYRGHGGGNPGGALVIGVDRVERSAVELPVDGVDPCGPNLDSKEPDLLRNGSIDLDVTVAPPAPPDVHSSMLFTEHFVAVVAADSRLGRSPHLTVDDLCRQHHVSASRRGLARGPPDEALEQLGRSRHVAAVVPSYAVGALMALEQDLTCLVPNVTAAHLMQRGVPLRRHEVPLDLPTADVELRWHRRVNDDPASQWLRERLRDSIHPLAAI